MNQELRCRGSRSVLILTGLGLLASAVYAGNRCGDADDCLRAMQQSIAKRGWMGIEYEEEGQRGLPEILKVLEDSPAAEGGMQAGDLLLSINGVSYAQPREKIYAEVKKALVPGNELHLVVDRDGEEIALTVVAGHVPDAVAAQWVGRHMLEYHLDSVSENDSDATAEGCG